MVGLSAAMVASGHGAGAAGRLASYLPEVGAALAITWIACTSPHRDRPAALWAMAVFAWGWVGGDAFFALNPAAEDLAYWNASRVFHAVGYAAALVGLAIMLRSRRPVRLVRVFDGLIVGLAIAAVLLATMYGRVLPTIVSGDSFQVMSGVYPLVDVCVACWPSRRPRTWASALGGAGCTRSGGSVR